MFLYLRPAIIGNGEQIGVTAPSEVLMFIIAVSWPDLSSGTRPGTLPKPPGLKLLASKSDVRAWPGGFGYAKVGANYGPAFVSHMEGRKMGYDQILWLLGADYQVRSTSTRYYFRLADSSRSQKLGQATSSLSGKQKRENCNWLLLR
jgi:branched-chain amino acid aminotransferase